MKLATSSDRMTVPRRVGFRWKTIVVLGMLWAGACKSDGTTGPGGTNAPATPEGAFTLNTIDSKVLPYSMYADTGYTLEVTSGSLSVTADHKWVSRMTTRETVAGNISVYTDSTFGTWSSSTGSTTASLLNTETNVISNATWTATDITVNDVDGAVTRKIVYRRN